MRDEADGLGAVAGVVEEGLVERGMAVRRHDRQDGVAQESEVFRASGFSPDPAILAPQSGILFPVVLVFHRPMAPCDFGKARVTCILRLQAGDEVAGFALEVRSALLFAMPTRQANQLPRSRKQGGIQIKRSNPQLAPFDPSVLALGLGDPIGGASVELFARELVEGGLVVLEGVEVVTAGGGDDQRRFFWPWSASVVTTAWGRTSAACRRRAWPTGSSQSSLAPL